MIATRRQALGAIGGLAAATAMPAHGVGSPGAGTPWTGIGDIRVGGGRLHYATVGQGSPVVMLPKLGGWIADWRHIAPLLMEGRQLIAIDPPGHGGSRMNGPAPHVMTVIESAAMILAVLDDMGIVRADFLGNSYGGVIALLIAATYPARVRKLALISTAMGEAMTRADVDKQDRERAAAGVGLIRSTAEQQARFGTVDPEISAEQAASNAQAGEWKRASERGVGLLGAADFLSRIVAPTLVVSADRGAYLRFNAVAWAKIHDVRVEIVAGSGSFVHQEKPVQAAALLNPFLKS
jgi:pimeloyl-ACP methyl ester carboxylesterase